MKKISRSRRGLSIMFFAFVVAAVILGILVFRKYETSHRKPQLPPQSTQMGTQLVALFFASPDGTGLVREGREIEPGADLEETLETLIDELISGPVGDYAPTLPPATRIIKIRVQGDTAEIDFSRELVDGLPSGGAAEMSAVYSVVDTIAANFQQLQKVQLLIEGSKVAYLKGHLDIGTPITADFSLEKR